MKKHKPIVWIAGGSAADNARAVLPVLARQFFDAGRKAAAPHATAAVMHQFRLRTKRFRYTLELFRPLYGPGLDKQLAALRSVQQCLGDLNDCATTLSLLPPESSSQSLEERKIRAKLSQRMAELQANFRQLWEESFATDTERRWMTYLARYAGQKRAKKPAGRRKSVRGEKMDRERSLAAG